ncbi:glycosyltransferase family 4 protein [Candidatus Parcubacteria bacterium]|nr:glycosyltransferase family 4 protein [Candidatus Parcubacteria bacterium]
MTRQPTICTFGIFNPGYSRSRMMRLGLESFGCRVVIVQDRTPGWRKYVNLRRKLKTAANQFDVLLVCFPGQTAMVLARLTSLKPVIFDAFTSLYDSDVYDRAVVAPFGWGALWRFCLDFLSLHLADFVLVDTEAQRRYYVRTFKLKPERIGVVPVGSVEGIMQPQPLANRQPGEPVLVHFHGNFIPLQGVAVILGAARLLNTEPIRFQIIGRGQQYDQMRVQARASQLTNVSFLEPVPYEELPRWMAQADICLGIFGATPKSSRVVPNKAFEALACRRPLITQDSPASREILVSGVHALLIPANDPAALAAAIRQLAADPALRERLAAAGHELFCRELTTVRIGERLKPFVERFL